MSHSAEKSCLDLQGTSYLATSQENSLIWADRIRLQDGKLMPKTFRVGKLFEKPTNALMSV